MASRRSSPSGGADGAPLHHYRIVVVASAVASLVESAGGFLCDRVREGWDVSVLLSEPCDARPLNILGVPQHSAPMPIDDAASLISGIPRAATLAVSADLLAGDAGVRHALARRAGQGLGVAIWGRPSHADVGRGLELTPHSLSAAARAFKTSAMHAAGVDSVADSDESLYRLRGAAFRRLYSV